MPDVDAVSSSPTCGVPPIAGAPAAAVFAGGPRAALAAARSVQTARATPPFTNGTSLVSPSWFGLPAADGDEHPVAVRRVGAVDHRRTLTSLRRSRP